MTPYHQQEVDRAFAAIRALCACETVPPPPRYFNDESDILDMMRGAAWVAHALFEPDPDGDSVIQFDVYEPMVTAVVLAPSDIYDYETRGMKRSHWTMPRVLEAIAKCDEVLSAEMTDEGASPFDDLPRLINPGIGAGIIRRIRQRLDERGRLSADGGWPEPDIRDERIVNNLMNDLIGPLTGNRMALRAVSRLSGARPISYPQRPGGRSARQHAEMALGQLADAVSGVARDYQLQRHVVSEEARQKRKEDEARAASGAVLTRILDKHESALRELGTPASEALLGYLVSGKRMPVFKSTQKRPIPERDALIDEIHALLGEGAHEVLMDLISGVPERNAGGVMRLESMLNDSLGREGPSPS